MVSGPASDGTRCRLGYEDECCRRQNSGAVHVVDFEVGGNVLLGDTIQHRSNLVLRINEHQSVHAPSNLPAQELEALQKPIHVGCVDALPLFVEDVRTARKQRAKSSLTSIP